ncbi:MAG: hypothetical protein AABP62_03315 [Planctomycetota bacterium]
MMRGNISNDIGDLRLVTPNADERSTASQTIRSLLQLAIVGLLIGVLLFHNVNLPVSVKGLFVVLLLWLIGRTSATPLLIAFQMILFFREPHRPATADGLGSFVFVVIVLGLLVFLSRDRTLRRVASRRVGDLIRSLFAKRDEDTDAAMSSESTRPATAPAHQPPIWFVRHIASLMTCVLAALLVLTTFPISGGVERGERSLAATKQVLEPVPLVLVATLIAVIAAAELAWRTLTMEQASMYLRSTQVNLLHADIRLIVRSRLKYRRRQKRTASKLPTMAVEHVSSVGGSG